MDVVFAGEDLSDTTTCKSLAGQAFIAPLGHKGSLYLAGHLALSLASYSRRDVLSTRHMMCAYVRVQVDYLLARRSYLRTSVFKITSLLGDRFRSSPIVRLAHTPRTGRSGLREYSQHLRELL